MHKAKLLIAVCGMAAALWSAAPCTAATTPAKGEKTISLAAGFAGYNTSALAGLEFTYRFSRHFRLAPSANYIFRHKGKDALTLNLNAHVPFEASRLLEVYPYAGINYSSWNFHHNASETDDVTTRKSRFGVNIGAGANLRLSGNLRIGIAADYVLIKHFSGAEIFAKIGYQF